MPVVDVKDRHTHLDLGQRLEYLETKEEAVWPWEVSSQPGWQVAHTDYPSFGLDTSSHWFRFGLRNISGEIQLVMLDLRHPLLDELDVFVLENGRIKRVWNTGLELALIQLKALLFPFIWMSMKRSSSIFGLVPILI